MRDAKILHLFGAFRLKVGSNVIDGFATRKAESLLRFLALRGADGASRFSLIDEFWPDSDVESGRKYLRQNLYLIRIAIKSAGGSDGIEANRRMVRLDDTWRTDMDLVANPHGLTPEELGATISELRGKVFCADDVEEWSHRERDQIQSRLCGLIAQAESQLELHRDSCDLIAETVAPKMRFDRRPRQLFAVSIVMMCCTLFGTVAVIRRAPNGDRLTIADDTSRWERRLESLPTLSPEKRADELQVFANTAFEHAYGGDEDNWRRLLIGHVRIINSTIEWCLENRPTVAEDIAGALWRLNYLTENESVNLEFLRRAVEKAPYSVDRTRARAESFLAMGTVIARERNGTDSPDDSNAKLATDAMEISRRIGDRWGLANATRAFAFAQSSVARASNLNRQYELYLEARREFTAIGDERGIALCDLCICSSGLPIDAPIEPFVARKIEAAMSARQRFNQIGNRWGSDFAIDRAWVVARTKCDFSKVSEPYHRAAETFLAHSRTLRSMGDPMDANLWAMRAAVLLGRCGDPAGLRSALAALNRFDLPGTLDPYFSRLTESLDHEQTVSDNTRNLLRQFEDVAAKNTLGPS